METAVPGVVVNTYSVPAASPRKACPVPVCLRVCIFWLQGSRISFVPLNGTLQETFAFHCFQFLISGRGGGKKTQQQIFSSPPKPLREMPKKTPSSPSEALSPLVTKPHHHLNCSILKVCENCIKLIFPISPLSVISAVFLLECCISWEQESKSI